MQKTTFQKVLPKLVFGGLLIAGLAFSINNVQAQKSKKTETEKKKEHEDKSKRPSPPATVKQQIVSGANITISYGQPSLNGRTPGIDVEPKEDTIWRAGANEATVFKTDKDVTINGQPLPAGKYAFFTLKHGNEWTLIFNKEWNTWGAYSYEKNKAQDALKVTVEQEEAIAPAQKLIYSINRDGKVSLTWGPEQVSFNVQ